MTKQAPSFVMRNASGYFVCEYQTTLWTSRFVMSGLTSLVSGSGHLGLRLQSRAAALRSVDWDRAATLYVVVDPLDPDGILYLSSREYKDLVRVCLSNDTMLEVLHRPGQPRPILSSEDEDSSPKIPPTPRSSRLSKRFLGTLARMFPNFNEENGMVSLNEGNFVKFVLRWGSCLIFWSGLTVSPRKGILQSFASKLFMIYKKHGVNYTITLLKASLVVVLQYLAGSPATSLRSLGVPRKCIHGLPAWLPRSFRSEIRKGNVRWIRIILSLLNMYKGIKGNYPDVPLDTICAPGFLDARLDKVEHLRNCTYLRDFRLFTERFRDQWFTKEDLDIRTGYDHQLPFLLKSGPNHSIGIFDAVFSGFAWLNLSPEILRENLFWLLRWGGYEVWLSWIIKRSKFLDKYPGRLCNIRFGKLSLKYEAAGKIRVFAIMDYWTQTASRIFHDGLFRLLKTRFSEVDGTFDQDGIVDTLRNKSYEVAYSYDLKSATDLIPKELYQVLLNNLFGEPAVRWLELITNRDFDTPKEVREAGGPEQVRYTRGQPMGCLGSWASLAIVHHALVQYSAFRAGWLAKFKAYAVLGDDIVIFNTKVAQEYVKVCAEFGIPIGLAKSFVSETFDPLTLIDNPLWDDRISGESALFNFANRTAWKGIDISVMSVKEELSCRTPNARIALAQRLYDRGWVDSCNFAGLLRLLFTAEAWESNQQLLRRGKLPLSGYWLVQLALSPRSDFLLKDKVVKMYMWILCKNRWSHIFSTAGRIGGRLRDAMLRVNAAVTSEDRSVLNKSSDPGGNWTAVIYGDGKKSLMEDINPNLDYGGPAFSDEDISLLKESGLWKEESTETILPPLSDLEKRNQLSFTAFLSMVSQRELDRVWRASTILLKVYKITLTKLLEFNNKQEASLYRIFQASAPWQAAFMRRFFSDYAGLYREKVHFSGMIDEIEKIPAHIDLFSEGWFPGPELKSPDTWSPFFELVEMIEDLIDRVPILPPVHDWEKYLLSLPHKPSVDSGGRELDLRKITQTLASPPERKLSKFLRYWDRLQEFQGSTLGRRPKYQSFIPLTK